jgi:hypothetical protein
MELKHPTFIFNIGKPGSGKTTLSRWLVDFFFTTGQVSRIMVVTPNTEHYPELPEHSVFGQCESCVKATRKNKEKKCMFKRILEYQDNANRNGCLEPMLLVIDDQVGSFEDDCCKKLGSRHRHLNLTIIINAHGPTNIGSKFRSYAQHIFCFKMTQEIDLKNVGGLVGINRAKKMQEMMDILIRNEKFRAFYFNRNETVYSSFKCPTQTESYYDTVPF